jgi:malonate transporter
MQHVLSLSLPFFGLIFLGYASGKIVRLPELGLAWLQFFVVYLALPALFFQLLSQTPVEELTNWRFVASTTLATAIAFALAFGVGLLATRRVPEATITALVGAYSNIGYMGPGLTLAALGASAAVPTALIFCFDNTLLFTLVPILMAIGGDQPGGLKGTILVCFKRIFTHPFILATIAGVAAAALKLEPPEAVDQLLTFLRSAAAPCALFALGVTVALRPLTRVPLELPLLLLIKLALHPFVVLAILGFFAEVPMEWVATAVLMASLPPAANCFVLASQYGVYIERASSAILIGTVASVATVTGVLWLITTHRLPHGLFG